MSAPGSDPPIPPAGLLLGSLGLGPEEEPWPNLGIAFAPLGVETKAPQPRPGGSRERDHHQRRSTGWGRASFGSRADTERPPHSACGGRPHGRRKTQISRIPHAAVSTPPSSRRLIKQQRCWVARRACQTFPAAVAEMTLAVAKLGMPRVARRARGRCPLMTNVPSTEAARRHEWSAATLRIHTEQDGRCSYCSERGSADPWPCLMARLAMHAKGVTTPPAGDAPE